MESLIALLTEKFSINSNTLSTSTLGRGGEEPSRRAAPDAGTNPFPKRGTATAPALAAGANSTNKVGTGCSH